MKGRLGRFVFIALPLLGVVELCAHLYFASRPPRFDEWSELRAPIEKTKKPGELVVVAPFWADPLARRALGDALYPLRDAARSDLTGYEKALEISILGQRDPTLKGWPQEEEKQIGKFTVRRLKNPSFAPVIYDFVDHLGPGSVDVRGTDPPVVCAWNPNARALSGGLGGHPTFPRERFECPGGVFFNVSVTVIADQDFKPRRCIWSHPLRRGELVTRFSGVPLGTSIHGHHGMYWIIEREKKGAPVTLTVRVDGDVIGQVTHRDGDGWSGFDLPLGAHANATSAVVELAVTTPDYRDRHYCFAADSR